VYVADQGGMPTAERRKVVINREKFIAGVSAHAGEATPTSTWGHVFVSVWFRSDHDTTSTRLWQEKKDMTAPKPDASSKINTDHL